MKFYDMSTTVNYSIVFIKMLTCIFIFKCVFVTLNAIPEIQEPNCDTTFLKTYLKLLSKINLKLKEFLFYKYDDFLVFVIYSNDMKYLEMPYQEDITFIKNKELSLRNLKRTLESLECLYGFLTLHIFEIIRKEITDMVRDPNNREETSNDKLTFNISILKEFVIRMMSIFINGYFNINSWQYEFSLKIIKMEPLESQELIATEEALKLLDDKILYSSIYKFCYECQKKNYLPASLKFFEPDIIQTALKPLPFYNYLSTIKSCYSNFFEIIKKNKFLDYKRKNAYLLITDYEKKESIPDVEFEMKKQKLIESLKLSESEIYSLERNTIDHSKSEMWRKNWGLRLASRHFGRVCTLQPTTSRDSTLKRILYSYSTFLMPNISSYNPNPGKLYGIKNEKLALKDFEKKTGKKVKLSGIFVDEKTCFFIASPDGIIDDDGIIEIKCPYGAQNMTIQEAFNHGKLKFMSWIKNKDNFHLKRDSSIYYQIQGQLHITKKQKCYFVIWTEKGMHIEIITKKDTFWEHKMEKYLIDFYMNYMVPKIIELQTQFELSSESK
ncbi:uncharacterized protein LOC126896992 [Daktulosphaira vitifoliae]|uniref:uncharacterized protein LOC126896992 n=1 Tax=Daktulosphaira vitifoliae TaxID=58002 RepID=UPI0021A9F86B|nr:uncharacterized protein LOC126896992 [Daktulosphaira vitifoliae]